MANSAAQNPLTWKKKRVERGMKVREKAWVGWGPKVLDEATQIICNRAGEMKRKQMEDVMFKSNLRKLLRTEEMGNGGRNGKLEEN